MLRGHESIAAEWSSGLRTQSGARVQVKACGWFGLGLPTASEYHLFQKVEPFNW